MIQTEFQFTWSELSAATGGRWLDPPPRTPGGITEVVTDSRRDEAGAMFLALKGESYDGHAFVGDAVAAGAAALCLETPPSGASQDCSVPCLLVEDTLTAYQDLARSHRIRFAQLQVVAVTGSSGKTSTKEIIGVVLEAACNGAVLVSAGNTNNQIGVPQNLLRLQGHERAAVLELGTNAPGEIAVLAAVARPDIGVLTNIGPAHLEGLGDMDGVAAEKARIFSCLDGDGFAVVPHAVIDHPKIRDAVAGKQVVTFGSGDTDADVAVRYLGGNLTSSRFRLYRRGGVAPLEISWPLHGAHQALNAAAAFAVAGILGIDDDITIRGLQNCNLPDMRMQVEERDDITWVNDAYNANPDSMRAHIDWLSTVEHTAQGTWYVVLGDMLELGEDEEKFHHDVLAYARTTLGDRAVLMPVGKRMERAAAGLDLDAFPEVEPAVEYLAGRLHPGDTVSLKASRGMALERFMT